MKCHVLENVANVSPDLGLISGFLMIVLVENRADWLKNPSLFSRWLKFRRACKIKRRILHSNCPSPTPLTNKIAMTIFATIIASSPLSTACAFSRFLLLAPITGINM